MEGVRQWVEEIEILKDGQLFVAGWFTSFQGWKTNGLALLNPDGSVDTSFTYSNYSGDRLSNLVLTEDYIYAGGLFVQSKSPVSTSIIRFSNSRITGLKNEREINLDPLIVYPNPFESETTVKYSSSYSGLILITVSNSIGEKLFEQRYIKRRPTFEATLALPNASRGVFLLQLVENNNSFTEILLGK